MARKRMKDIVSAAKKRRALYLKEFDKLKAKDPEFTITEFGSMKGLTGERMGQHIKKARQDLAG